MARKDRMSGNEAVSYAIRQINPDVMPAFPITPSTEIPQMVSTYIANGEMDTEFIPVESEHSSMSATIGAEAAGARSLTATSSAGLALMWEELQRNSIQESGEQALLFFMLTNANSACCAHRYARTERFR